MIHRLLLLAFLGYVTLDLSLPAMPGAFVFDPSGSVESVDGGRIRPTDKTIVLPMPSAESSLPLRQPRHDSGHRLDPIHTVSQPARIVVNYLPRAVCASPRPSEDPH